MDVTRIYVCLHMTRQLSAMCHVTLSSSLTVHVFSSARHIIYTPTCLHCSKPPSPFICFEFQYKHKSKYIHFLLVIINRSGDEYPFRLSKVFLLQKNKLVFTHKIYIWKRHSLFRFKTHIFFEFIYRNKFEKNKA